MIIYKVYVNPMNDTYQIGYYNENAVPANDRLKFFNTIYNSLDEANKAFADMMILKELFDNTERMGNITNG